MTPRRALPRWQRTPDGMRDWLPEELGRLRTLEARFRALFGAWGYREVATPVLEYLDSVVHGIGEAPEGLFVVVDRSGELLVLRPEMTVPIARLAASRLTGRTLRLCYFAEVFRGRRPTRGAGREFRQAGVERLGDRGCEADAEVIALAAHALREAGVRDFRIGVGHAGFLRELLETAGLDADDRHTAQALLYRRDFVTLRGLLADAPAQIREAVLSLPALRGADAAAVARDVGIGEEALAEVEAVLAALHAFGVDAVEIDLGLIRDFDYYTGVVFEGYAPGVGLPLLGGGRYDGLLARFGSERPAIGFAIEVERVLSAVEASWERPPALQIAYQPEVRREALAVAQRARNAGWTVVVDPHPAEPVAGTHTLLFTTAGARLRDPGGAERAVSGAELRDLRSLLEGAAWVG